MTDHRLSLSEGPVLTRVEGSVLHVTLNKPESLNSVDATMLDTLEGVVRAVGTRQDLRCVVVRGAGKGFCSGADLNPDLPPSPATLDAGAAYVTAVRHCPVPVVAAVHGPCAGIGVSMALASDLVVASRSAFFLLAFTKIGLMPDGGATALVSASIGRARAMRMALLAERVPGDQAYDWGLISHLFADDEFEDGLNTLVQEVVAGPTAAYGETKKAVNDATLVELESSLHRERYGQTALMTTPDFTEGVAAFRERRPAVFTGRPTTG